MVMNFPPGTITTVSEWRYPPRLGTKKAGSMFLTLHARVMLNKRLKKIHRTRIKYRITFYPEAGCTPTTVHRSVSLLRAPRKKKHHRH